MNTRLDAPLERLEVRVRTLWRLKGAVAVVVLAAATGIVLAVFGTLLPAVVAAVGMVVVGLALVVLLTAVAWRAWGYRIDDAALTVRHGVFVRVESSVPYRRIQHIDLESGPLQRVMELRTLALRTAAASSDGTIPGIDASRAEALRARILERAGQDDAV